MTDNTPTVQAPGGLQASNPGKEIASFVENVMPFAEMVAKSGLAPKGLQTIPAIITALQMGSELGLSPMAALQNIAVINGRPSVWGDAQLAICRSRPEFDGTIFEESFGGEQGKDSFYASCTVGRKGEKPVTRKFSVAAAKRACLWGKQGPWTQYPTRMLQCRARSWALRDCFPDALRGFRSAEENRDIIDVEPIRADDMTLDAAPSQASKIAAAAGVDEPSEPEEFTIADDIFDCHNVKSEKKREEIGEAKSLDAKLREMSESGHGLAMVGCNRILTDNQAPRIADLSSARRHDIIALLRVAVADASDDDIDATPKNMEDCADADEAVELIDSLISRGFLDANFEEGVRANYGASNEADDFDAIPDEEKMEYAKKAWARASNDA